MNLHPEFEARDTFEHLRLGRRPARRDPRTLRMARYLAPEVVLPELPPVCDWGAAVPSWPMYGNDTLGDCTAATAGHMIQAWTAAAGHPATPPDQEILDLYWALGSADDGRFELDVLNYWRNVGLGGEAIVGYVAVDPANLDQVRAAIYLFGGVYAGVGLPITAQTQAVWDVADSTLAGPAAPDSWGGHAIPYVAYDVAAGTFDCVTWGHPLKLTYGFHGAYCNELYAVISPSFLNAGVSPAGFDLAMLQADLDTIAAH